MPWNQTNEMKERLKMIGEYLSGGYGPAGPARRYGVSRKSVYKWIARYEQAGAEGLQERSSAPHNHPNATELQVVEHILRLKARWPHWARQSFCHGCSASLKRARILRRARLATSCAGMGCPIRSSDARMPAQCPAVSHWGMHVHPTRCGAWTSRDGSARAMAANAVH
ncbi:MAG: Transposase [Prosthecobacter sp.]|nr:Transposase [Prosthecobacter sp.]